MSEENEIREVIAEERRRGANQKRLETTTAEQRARVRKSMLKAIREADEGSFIEAILDLGHAPGSPDYERMLKLWRENVRTSRP